MSFKQIFLLYVITLIVFILIDMVWLGVVAKGFYRKHLGPFMTPKVVWPAAVLFYLLFIAGLNSGKPAGPTFKDGLATDYVTDAVLKSAKTGKWERVKKPK